MSCRVELNEEVIIGLCHLVECVLADDFDTRIHKEVVLFIHFLCFGFDFLDNFGPRIRLFHYLQKFIEVVIVCELADLSVVECLKGVTVENKVGVQHANNLHFGAILLDFILLVEELN